MIWYWILEEWLFASVKVGKQNRIWAGAGRAAAPVSQIGSLFVFWLNKFKQLRRNAWNVRRENESERLGTWDWAASRFCVQITHLKYGNLGFTIYFFFFFFFYNSTSTIWLLVICEILTTIITTCVKLHLFFKLEGLMAIFVIKL